MRRALGLLAAGLGSFLLVSALVLRFYVADQAIKSPLNQYQVSTYVAPDVTYFNPTLLRELTGVTMRDTVTVEGDQAGGSAGRAVWNQFSYWYDETSRLAYQQLTQRLAFSRRSGLLIDCCATSVGGKSGVRVSGQGYVWPFGTRHATYDVFDTTLLRPEPARYAGTAVIDGLATDKFVEQVPATRFRTQTLPGRLVGLADQASVTLGEFYRTTTTYWVEPVTGQVVDRSSDEDLSLRGGGARVLTLFRGDLAMDQASVAVLAAAAKSASSRASLVTARIPLPAGLAGVILLALGCVLALVGGRQPEYDPGYREAAAFQPTGPRR